VAAPLYRYRSSDEDSGRWERFELRPDDIVISTRSKSGTTWMQMICALLVLRTPELPAPLTSLSPWLDWLVVPEEELFARLAAQPHRRFIKTHTPLDGVPIRPGVTYVVVARHPLDMAVSLYHQSANLDRERIAELTGTPVAVRRPRLPLDEWLASWTVAEVDPREQLDSLQGVLHHLTDAWQRRSVENVVLVHYDDLRADLEGEMRRLADRLGIPVAEAEWPALVEAATFERMRARADEVAPDPSGILKDRAAFFRGGVSGSGEALLSARQLDRYLARVAELAPPDLVAWLHRRR
jgi:aryl sulfotransferase